jgi:hypothetical protein
MTKWTAGITLTGLTALTGGVDPAVSTAQPDRPPLVKSIDAEKKPAPFADKNLDQVRKDFEKLEPKQRVRLFASLNEKQKALFVDALETEKEKFPARAETIDPWLQALSLAEKDAWLEVYKVRPSDMEHLASNANIITVAQNYAYDPIEVTPIGLKAFNELLAPKITRVTVDTPIRNRYAYGFLLETDVDPTGGPYGAEKSKERISQFALAIDKPGGEAHFTSTPKGVKVTFPEASLSPKGNINLADADIKKLYEMVTQKEFKVENSFIPWQQNEKDEDKLTRVQELIIKKGIISSIKLNTAPGAKLYLTSLQGTKDKPYPFSGPANATYIFDKTSQHIRVDNSTAPPSPEGFQNAVIYEIPIEVAQGLKAEYKQVPAKKVEEEENKDKDVIKPLGTRHVILKNAKQNLEFKCGDNYYAPIPELEKVGTKLNSVKGVLRIRKGDQYVDISLMDDTKYVHKNEKTLEKRIRSAIKKLDPMVEPKRGFHKDMETGVLEDWQKREREHRIAESRKPFSKL